MLNKVVNGYTIIAQHHDKTMGSYLVMGMRLVAPATYTYVTAHMMNVDRDTQWYWGSYGGADFADNIIGATENFKTRGRL